MPLCQKSSKCAHPAISVVTQEAPGLNRFCTKCGLCEASGPWCVSRAWAEHLFWKQETETKENSMSQTYEQGYKQGVVDATQPLPPLFTGTREDMNKADEIPGYKSRSGLTSHGQINLHLENVRKKLLTKKVTKWFAVYDNFGTGSLRTYGEAIFGKTTLFNTKEEALKQLDGVDVLVGAYPIEIEVKL